MTGFENHPVQDLPALADDAFVPVDPSYLKMALTVLAIVAAVLSAGIGLLAALTPISALVLTLLSVGVVLFLGAIAFARVLDARHMAYQVRAHDLSYRRGVLFQTVSTVPFVRVQHARISQGPIERRFGLASLDVNSAGPDIHVRGLTTDTADRLKVLVVERASDLVEDE